MSKKELPKAYNFKDTEERIYKMWEEGGYFRPSNDPNKPDFDPNVKPFTISIPPPNVTGELHLGHAMFVSMEDLMIRYHRMKGYSALWVPGTDHAGIATQLMVSRHLMKTEEVTLEEIGREKFLEHAWKWKEQYHGRITGQIRRLGASCDWERERFTLDDGLSKAVREAFVRLHEKGLIYRGPRLINWSPGLKTAVSDLEVEYHVEEGKLYYFKYMLAGDSGDFIPVATTRPETILGDTAVAVHPEDERYQKFVGKKVLVPMLGREIPVIADEYVEREFGTGALKITPAHDPNDYQIGEKYNLPLISILDKDAKVNENGGQYEGMDRFDARKKLWDDMREAGLVIKEENHTHQVPRSQRGGEIIEPMISTQWFVKMESIGEKALNAVKNGEITIVPDYFTKTYYNWMENLQDWCISRQLWWGHRIPVWYCADCNEITVSREDATKCAHCASANIKQDEDVLDTWFSSGLWTFSTLGWPEKTPDFEYFHPTSIMETGADILFFWVARMIMSSLEFVGEIPFHTIYLHGLIFDEHGKKMSKTKGNVIDPLIVMDDLGTDALRFTLLVGSTPGKNSNLSLKKVEANRNFANKIWNASRFVFSMIDTVQADDKPDTVKWTLADSWIWARLQNLVRSVERLFAGYQYGEAGRQIYDFFWGDFADWYLEIAKLQMQDDETRYTTAETLARVLDITLRLLHPFTPFVTEELWGHLRQTILGSPLSALAEDWADVLISASWPKDRDPEGWEDGKIAEFELIQEMVRVIRNLRSEKGVAPGKRIAATFVGGEETPLVREQAQILGAMARIDEGQMSIVESIPEKPEGSVALVVGSIEIYIPLEGMVDLAKERERLESELKDAESHIARLEKMLNSPFAQKAPPAVVDKEREKLAGYKETAEKIKAQL
ncbi:MAG: valine--tRNA ligase [Anaerolineae bacterium]|jgi:valyl-tRNA synthetase|nr:valine--tRNA ligase [Anaerolineae bacterium]MBT7188671.1 valine--tRNA ligase [Anaerolineae bacterium]MBT7989807.1 valine--tRNA ligase [Anaerolineae bacterium]